MAMIMVVDDNEDNRTVLSRMLKLAGYDIRTAENGKRAIEEAVAQAPDLILMDLSMPEMDGWAATSQLKAIQGCRHIPVIIVTGHVTSDDIVSAQQVGCDDLVSKPVDYNVLIGKVNQYLPSAHRPASAA